MMEGWGRAHFFDFSSSDLLGLGRLPLGRTAEQKIQGWELGQVMNPAWG